MSCKGDGSCLNQCCCECFDCYVCKLSENDCKCECNCDEDTCICYKHFMRQICTCGHREHNGYCKPEKLCPCNCEPKLCPNDKNHDEDYNGANAFGSSTGIVKGLLYPEWFFGCHGGNCSYCGQLYGHGFVHTNEIKECPICYENKLMTSLRCKHELCWDCWSSICKSKEDVEETRASCPLCRRKKW